MQPAGQCPLDLGPRNRLDRSVTARQFLRVSGTDIVSTDLLNSDQPVNPNRRDYFAVMAAAYLALPSLVFLLTWLRPGVGIPVAVIVTAAFVVYLRRADCREPRPKLPAKTWAFVLLAALAWSLLGGAGGFVLQADDYEKHNLAFHDLIRQSWPVEYITESGTNYLCYGLGYYLVPAFIARVVGEAWLPVACLAWAFAGLALFFYWVATFSRSPRATLAIVLLFAGTEALWHMFLHILHTPAFAERGALIRGSLDHLGILSAYSDNFSAFQYRPQHVLPAWLGMALFYDMFRVRGSPRAAGFILAVCCLWSPLMCVGLLLLPLATLKEWRWQDALEPVNFAGLILLGVLAIYFQGHVPVPEQGPIWIFANGSNWLLLYACFVLLQLSPMVFLCLAAQKYNVLGELRPLAWGSLLLLLLLPLYKIGYYGDLRLQAQTPALLIFGLAAARCWQSPGFSLKRPFFALLVASQVLGAIYPVARWWQKALSERVDYSYTATQQRHGYQNLSDFKRDGFDYAAQYLGRTNSLAYRWLLK